jgi:hypothetical protein
MTQFKPTPIPHDQPFRFRCSPQVSCFNDCCRNLNQFLTPYDIVRLKNHLGMNSGAFLKTHCRWHIGPETGLPIVTLKAAEPVHRTCRFLSPQGCTVYAHRPSSCRVYPLIRTVGYRPGTGETPEAYLLLKEPHCRGFETPDEQTVAEWVAGQGLAEYNRHNDELMAFISRKRRLRPGPLDGPGRKQVFTALYDLDALRKSIVKEGKLEGLDIGSGEMAAVTADDLALLKLGIRWLTHSLSEAKS